MTLRGEFIRSGLLCCRLCWATGWSAQLSVCYCFPRHAPALRPPHGCTHPRHCRLNGSQATGPLVQPP